MYEQICGDRATWILDPNSNEKIKLYKEERTKEE